MAFVPALFIMLLLVPNVLDAEIMSRGCNASFLGSVHSQQTGWEFVKCKGTYDVSRINGWKLFPYPQALVTSDKNALFDVVDPTRASRQLGSAL